MVSSLKRIFGTVVYCAEPSHVSVLGADALEPISIEQVRPHRNEQYFAFRLILL